MKGGIFLKKRLLTIFLSGILVLGLVGILPAVAAEWQDKIEKEPKSSNSVTTTNQIAADSKGTDQENKSVKEFDRDRFRGEEREKYLVEYAKSLGISTDGRDFETIKEEIQHTLLLQKAEELGIDTEGKDFETIQEEILKMDIDIGKDGNSEENLTLDREKMTSRVERLLRNASDYGVLTDGKDPVDALKELEEALLQQKAAEFGISTEGKDKEQIIEELKEKAILQKAKELGISTEGKSLETILQEIMEKL